MIVIKLVATNYFHRWHCTVCGGMTEKDAILCVGESDGREVQVCSECLKSPELVDEKLEQHAIGLVHSAEYLRSLKANLQLPSHEEWELAAKDFEQSCGLGGDS